MEPLPVALTVFVVASLLVGAMVIIFGGLLFAASLIKSMARATCEHIAYAHQAANFLLRKRAYDEETGFIAKPPTDDYETLPMYGNRFTESR